jgi:hypothetical protein
MSSIFALSFRGFSSAGSEHLPYKQRVGGSNPSTPTTLKPVPRKRDRFCFRAIANLFAEGDKN